MNRQRNVLAATLRPVLPESSAHIVHLTSACTSVALETEQAQQTLINSIEIQNHQGRDRALLTSHKANEQLDLESPQRQLHSDGLCG